MVQTSMLVRHPAHCTGQTKLVTLIVSVGVSARVLAEGEFVQLMGSAIREEMSGFKTKAAI